MKKTITAHMALTKAQRQAHINLSSACILGARHRMKQTLADYHNIEMFSGRNIHTAHLCPNDTSNKGKVCLNPEHLYFATPSENFNDIPPEDRSTARLGKSGRKPGFTHTDEWKEQQAESAKKQKNNKAFEQATCPHCGKTGQLLGMKPWHFDKCKKRFTKE